MKQKSGKKLTLFNVVIDSIASFRVAKQGDSLLMSRARSAGKIKFCLRELFYRMCRNPKE